MRSKEVEKAIEQFKKYIKEPITTTTDERMGYTKIKTKFHIPSEKNIETVLSYIEELEKLPNKIRAELNKQYDLYNSIRQKEYSQEVIDTLEELLEGE